MDYENLKKKLEGCYVTVPTPFKDVKNLPLNFDALKDYVEFLLGNGLDRNNCTLLFGGAAGYFSPGRRDTARLLGAAPAPADLGEHLHDGQVLAVVELVALRFPLCQTIVDGLGLI